MPSIVEDVKNYIKNKKYGFVTDVRYQPDSNTVFLYIPQDRVVAKVKKGFTSSRQLGVIKRNIEEKFDKPTEAILTESENHIETEEGIRHILNKKYNDQISSIRLSFENKDHVNIWIVVADFDEELHANISEHLRNVLTEVSLSVGSIFYTNADSKMPSPAFLLRTIKIHQPINLSKMLELLNKDDFYAPIHSQWLNRKLDSLRRKGYLQRGCDKCYTLTAEGIIRVPVEIGDPSSDIERALAFKEKKW